MRMITAATAESMLKGTNGKIFAVTFIKKTTGESRRMVARTGVKKFVTGEGMKYNPIEKKLLTVFDMQKKEYRMVNLSTLRSIKIAGKEYPVEYPSLEK